jgi:cysteine desulfurase
MDNKQKPIYFDYQSTTPLDKRVFEAMTPYFLDKIGNPHSRNHIWGFEAEDAIEEARYQIAKVIKADLKDIIFTSGATESNNLTLKGVMDFYSQNNKNHVIVSKIEHKCILSTAHYLEEKGFKVTYLPVKENGIIDLDVLKSAITDKTALVSIMAVNNEIGVIQPLVEIGKICREKGVFFHTDAAQAIGKIHIDVNLMNIDLLSISGHKMYGPKGIGALYIRRKPRVKLLPQIHGGGQERGLRSGTLATPLCVGLGKACDIIEKEIDKDIEHAKELQKMFLDGLNGSLEKIYLNGDLEQRVANNLNISFAGVEGESLLLGINNKIAVSSGSACTSSSLEGSYVLRALGVEEDLAHTSIRIGFGRFTTKEDVQIALNCLIERVKKLREISPIWDMIQAGVDLKSIKWVGH